MSSSKRTCKRCGEGKNPDMFPRRSDGRPGPWCRPCRQAYDRAYYAATRERRLARKAVNDARRAQRNRTWVWAWLLEHPCVDCGETDPIVLEFDHQEEHRKDALISDLIGGAAGLDRIRREIDKCDVRCANCHRRRTAEQFGWFRGT